MDDFGLGVFGCLYSVTVSLEGLAKVGEANANAGHQHFIPTLAFFITGFGFNFKHNLEKALQMPQKFYPKKKRGKNEKGI